MSKNVKPVNPMKVITGLKPAGATQMSGSLSPLTAALLSTASALSSLSPTLALLPRLRPLSKLPTKKAKRSSRATARPYLRSPF